MNISASLLLKYTKPILHQTPNSPRNHKATTTKAEVDVDNSKTANFPVHKSITVFHRSERLCVIKIKKVTHSLLLPNMCDLLNIIQSIT